MADFAKLILAAETGDLKEAQVELAKLSKSAEGAEKSVKKSSKGMSDGFARAQRAASAAGLAMSAAITAPLLALGASSIRAAANLEEIQGKFNVVFGSLASSTEQWTKQTSAAMNRSQTDFKEYASGFQDLLVPMGFTREKAAELSKQFVELGVDVASFNNASDPEAINALRSAIVGSSEPMLRFGVDTRAARVEQELLAMGINKSYQEATEQEKVIARLNIAMGMSADAIGDAVRTGDSYTNQLKGLNAGMKEASETIGKLLVPHALKLVEALNGALESFRSLSPATQETIVKLGAVAAALGPLLLGLSGLMMVAKPLIAALGSGGIAGALGALGTVATGPVGWVIAGVVALSAAIVIWGDDLKELSAGLNAFNDELNPIPGAMREFIASLDPETVKAFSAAIDKATTDALRPYVLALGLAKDAVGLLGGALDAIKGKGVNAGELARSIQHLEEMQANFIATNDKAGIAAAGLAEFEAQIKKQVPTTEDLAAAAVKLAAAKKHESDLDGRAIALKRELMTEQDLLTETVAEAALMLDTGRFSQDQYNLAVINAYKETDVYTTSAERAKGITESLAASQRDSLALSLKIATDAQNDQVTALAKSANTYEKLISVAGKWAAIMSGDVSRALTQVRFETDEMSQFAIQAARNMQTAFADFLFDPFDGGLKGMFDNFSKTLRRMAAEIAASKIGGALFGKDGTGGIFGGIGAKLGGVITSAGSKLGGILGSALGAAGSFIPVIGPLIGSAIGAALPKLGGLLFGGSFKTTDAGIQLGIGGAGVTGSQFEDQHRKGGLFRGSKDRTLTTALDATTAQGFQDAYDSIIDNAQVVFAGIGADIDRSALEAVRIAGLKISTSGKSQAEVQALIDQWFATLDAAVVGAAAEASGALGLLALAQAGETASQTITRLGSQIQGVNDVLAMMDATLLSVSVDGARFADNIVQLAGGIDNLASGVSSFVDNFYSDERKFERIQSDLTATFSALGLEIPATREAVVALVDGLDLTTEAGQRAFVAITGASSSMNTFFSTLESQASAAAAAAEARAREAEAARAAEAAAVAQRFQESKSGTDAALGALRASIQERKTALQREQAESTRVAQAASAASLEANQAALNAAQSTLSKLTPEVQAISAAMSGLRTSLAGSDARSRESALATIQRALATGNLAGTGEAAGIAANVQSGTFSTAADFRREQARTLSLLGRLEDDGEKQVDQAEAAVRAIQSQTAAIEQGAAAASAQASAQFDDEMAALDKQLAEAEEQVNLLRGIETGVLSMAEALANFRTALEMERGLTPGSAPSGIQEQRGREHGSRDRMERALQRIEEYSRSTARSNGRLLDIDDRRYREEQAEVVV